MSSQVIKHGSTNTTLKWSGKVYNGRLPIPHDQQNSVGLNQESKLCCWLFFDIRGIVHYEIVPSGQTVNQVYYLEVLERLHDKVRRKQPEIFANNSWILIHDNAPAHTALSVREFVATKQTTVLEHPAYSPDLAPRDFFCSQREKKYWKEGILMTLMTSGVIQWHLWRPFHNISSKIALKGGLGASIGA